MLVDDAGVDKRVSRNSLGVIRSTSSAISLAIRVTPLIINSSGSASAVSAIRSDMPDCENVFWVPDADLDVVLLDN